MSDLRKHAIANCKQFEILATMNMRLVYELYGLTNAEVEIIAPEALVAGNTSASSEQVDLLTKMKIGKGELL